MTDVKRRSPSLTARVTNDADYNRLVRDRIPEIVESGGNIPVWRELDDDAFSHALLETIRRSGEQFAETASLELLADLLEAADAWLELQGLGDEELSRARAERRKRCGGYEHRRFLEKVMEGTNARPLIHWPRC